jgi:hypothetical protein
MRNHVQLQTAVRAQTQNGVDEPSLASRLRLTAHPLPSDKDFPLLIDDAEFVGRCQAVPRFAARGSFGRRALPRVAHSAVAT